MAIAALLLVASSAPAAAQQQDFDPCRPEWNNLQRFKMSAANTGAVRVIAPEFRKDLEPNVKAKVSDEYGKEPDTAARVTLAKASLNNMCGKIWTGTVSGLTGNWKYFTVQLDEDPYIVPAFTVPLEKNGVIYGPSVHVPAQHVRGQVINLQINNPNFVEPPPAVNPRTSGQGTVRAQPTTDPNASSGYSQSFVTVENSVGVSTVCRIVNNGRVYWAAASECA